MASHPVLDLSEQDVLGATIAEQAIQLDTRFLYVAHGVKFLASLLEAIERSQVVYIFYKLLVKLVMESLKVVAEVGTPA